jgi:hypothetical protein
MALTYLNFKEFPTEIEGITSDYNSKITAVESFVISDIAAVGVTVSDAILSCFVFWFICQDAATTATIKTGETSPIAKTYMHDYSKQIQAWNYGVDQLIKLLAIPDTVLKGSNYLRLSERIHYYLEGEGVAINENYLSKISWL